MKTIKTTIILILISSILTSYSQTTTSFSAYSSFDFSQGVELRGEFERDWYISMQVERFYHKEAYNINWGFSVGVLREISRSVTFLGGGRVGMISIQDNGQKPSFGLEAELDYMLSEVFYVGLRGSADVYFNTINDSEPPNTEKLIRGFIKIGFKF
jgi:hypothetical protein